MPLLNPIKTRHGCVADVFDRVSVSLRDVADVALLQRLGPVTTARAEHRYADLALDDVLPLVGRRVPVQFPQRPRIEVEDRAGNRLGNRKIVGIDQPQPASLVVDDGRLGEQPPLVGLRRQLLALERRRRFLRRHDPRAKYTSFSGNPSKVDSGTPKFFASSGLGVWPIQSVMLNVPNSEK